MGTDDALWRDPRKQLPDIEVPVLTWRRGFGLYMHAPDTECWRSVDGEWSGPPYAWMALPEPPL